MRISLIQMNSRTASRDENVRRACEFIATAAADGAELAVLPEMFHCEYFPQYRDYRYINPSGEIAGKYRKVHPAAA